MKHLLPVLYGVYNKKNATIENIIYGLIFIILRTDQHLFMYLLFKQSLKANNNIVDKNDVVVFFCFKQYTFTSNNLYFIIHGV